MVEIEIVAEVEGEAVIVNLGMIADMGKITMIDQEGMIVILINRTVESTEIERDPTIISKDFRSFARILTLPVPNRGTIHLD